jgi:hypothetical protein
MSVRLEIICTAIVSFGDPILKCKFSLGDSFTSLPCTIHNPIRTFSPFLSLAHEIVRLLYVVACSLDSSDHIVDHHVPYNDIIFKECQIHVPETRKRKFPINPRVQKTQPLPDQPPQPLPDLPPHDGMASTSEPEDGRELYALLHLSPDASDEEVRRAYRSFAQIYHPDKYQDLQVQLPLVLRDSIGSSCLT